MCEVWPPLPAGRPTAPGPAGEGGRAKGPALSMLRCRRRRLRRGASGLVVDRVVLGRRAPRLAVPYRDRAGHWGLQYDLADRLPNEVGHTTAGAGGCFPQRVEFFLPQIDLCLFHVCHSSIAIDIRQFQAGKREAYSVGAPSRPIGLSVPVSVCFPSV